MTRIARLPVVLLALVAIGCSGASPGSGRYTFDPGDSAVKVDGRQLQEIKADAGIEPCPPSTLGATAQPDGLPDATLPCLGGGHSVDLAGLRGPLVLNFWGQFCGPCRAESPLLQQLAAAARGRVKVVGLDFYDPSPTRALQFADELGLTYPQLADPNAATRAALRISGLPMTFFVDRSGRITYTHAGAITSEEQLDQLVEEHLGVSVASQAGS
jgi:cytochrome c biogenesis protein CcmG, thiol:disulfide interchange protein DsbE